MEGHRVPLDILLPDNETRPAMTEPPWNLLQDTMEAVNNVLGDFLINQIEHDSSNTSDIYQSDYSLVLPTSDPLPLSPEFEAVQEDMEPQPRARSNTWPKRHFGLRTGESIGLPQVNEETSSELSVGHSSGVSKKFGLSSAGELPAQPLHRKNSRRNPWGNCSYSDLIEQVQFCLNISHRTESFRPSSPPRTRDSP